jgi:hypothetical protein
MMAENDVSGGPSIAAAAPVTASQAPWVVFIAVLGAALCGYDWANPCPAQPRDTFVADQARTMGYFLIVFVAGALASRSPLQGLRGMLYLLPLYVVAQVPPVVATTVGWEGGWALGLAGAAAGAAGGTVAGWLLFRWTEPDIEKNRPGERARAILLPITFGLLFALYGGYTWGHEPARLDEAWVIGLGWVLLAVPGVLVGRPFLGLLLASPLVLLTLVPLVASLAGTWEGGWVLGSAGAATGAALGALKGWLFNRWLMPEYDKRRAGQTAVQPSSPTAVLGSSESMLEQGAEPFLCPTCTAALKKGALFCERCGTIKWVDAVGTLAAGLLFVGLGALVVWGSLSLTSKVGAWMVYILGACILALCAAAYVMIFLDLARARELASSWRRSGSLDGNGPRP